MTTAISQSDIKFALALAARHARKVPWMRDEFESAAMVGLAAAHRTFDPDRNAAFQTFAYWRIVGSIKDAARSWELSGYRQRTGKRHKNKPKIKSLCHEDKLKIGAIDSLPVGWEIEHHDEILAIARQLPRAHRHVFVTHLTCANARSGVEAARVIGIDPTRVSQIMTNARQKLTTYQETTRA